jgi:hypothetical protein
MPARQRGWSDGERNSLQAGKAGREVGCDRDRLWHRRSHSGSPAGSARRQARAGAGKALRGWRFHTYFHRPGYEWDVGLHYIGQMQDERSTVRRAFDHVTDGRVQWQPMPEFTTASSSKAGHSTLSPGWSAFGRASGNRFPARPGPSTAISRRFDLQPRERPLLCGKGGSGACGGAGWQPDADAFPALGKTARRARCWRVLPAIEN